MTIAYVAIGTRVDTNTGTPTLAYPVGIVSGDFLVACAHYKTGTSVMAAPSNSLVWTDTGSGAVNMKVFTATYDGLATAPTIDATGGAGANGTYGRMFALRCSNAIVVDAIADSGATQANMRYPALTLTSDNEFVFTYCRSNSASTSVAVDSGFIEIEDISLSAAAASVQIQYQIQTARTNIVAGNPVMTGSSSLAVHGITLAFTEGLPSVAKARTLMLGVG